MSAPLGHRLDGVAATVNFASEQAARLVGAAREAEAARRSDDGGRAWVIRDSLNKLPADSAARLRATVDGIRRRPGAPSTSRAAATAAQFDLTGAAQRPAASTGRNSAP